MAATPQNRLSVDVKDRTFRSRAPKGQIGYAQVIANQTGITVVTDLTGLSVTVSVGAGRAIKISCQIIHSGTVADGRSQIGIKEGVTTLQLANFQRTSITGNTAVSSIIITPTAGIHTYKLTQQLLDGTGTVGLAASSIAPSFILVEDIGAA